MNLSESGLIAVVGLMLTGVGLLAKIAFSQGKFQAQVSGQVTALALAVADVRSVLDSEGEEAFVRQRQINLMAKARDGEMRVIDASIDHLRGVTDAHTAQIAVHSAQIAALREG